MRTHSDRILMVLLGTVMMLAGLPARATAATPGSGVPGVQTMVYYHAVTARHSGKCLDLDWGRPDDGTAIIQWTCHGGLNQQWRFDWPLRSVFAFIVAPGTGKCLAVRNDSAQDGADIVEMPCDGPSGDSSRMWWVVPLTGGYVSISNGRSGKCLDVRDVSQEDGARIQLWSCDPINPSQNQQWLLHD